MSKLRTWRTLLKGSVSPHAIVVGMRKIDPRRYSVRIRPPSPYETASFNINSGKSHAA